MEMSLRILLIGGGGREHALAWKLSQSRRVEIIYAIPGNGGTAGIPKVQNIDSVKADDYIGLLKFSKENKVDLVVPGPEAPLVDGIEGYFPRDIHVFGPSKEAARMEGSKTFSKDFMQRNRIPTAEYRNFSDYKLAQQYISSVKHDFVIKASGLAGGKGVIIPQSKEEAERALKEIMVGKEFGTAGDEVVIEEFLEGDELSILTFSDGHSIKSLPPAQDHKRIFDGDQGPNTGGMGCYAPTKVASPALVKDINETILQPTIDSMRKEGFPFVGVLFTGLMLTKTGPKVLEYNVRFGDPETQTLLPLLSPDTDLADVMLACTTRRLDFATLEVERRFAATVVVSAAGYPGSYAKGTSMALSPVEKGTILFHAGTAMKGSDLTTSGGRVIAATATAETLEDAVTKAYKGVESIKFEGMYYRRDIAHRAFKDTTGTEEAFSYAQHGGVDIASGNLLVERIRTAVRSTRIKGADGEIGGFGGTIDLLPAGYTKPPILVLSIDGVGTKLKIAHTMGKHETVGIDLVAMSVNDLVVQGARPLGFLDCFSCSKLVLSDAVPFVEGVAAGCRLAGCVLSGGETAEMPGLYSGTDYDGVGAAVGAIDRDAVVLPNKAAMEESDILLGLASSGVHSNGFSLVRKIIEIKGLSYHDPAPWHPETSVGESLLTPTRIYVQSLLPLVQTGLIKGMAHITGGGLIENIPRMLPQHLKAEVDVATWKVPDVLLWLKKAGHMEPVEFARTFNTGIGMVLCVALQDVIHVMADLENSGETVYEVGRLVSRAEGEDGCVLKSLEGWA